MTYYIVKIIVTTLLIVFISEVSKRSSFVGAVLASVPLISVLAMMWLYIDTKDTVKVSELSSSIFWLVLPSLSLFIVLPLFLKQDINFYLSITLSTIVTAISYWVMILVLNHFEIKL